MGCSSEKCIPESKYNIKDKKSIITEDNIEIDLHDIEKQGESKHPQREINNHDNIEEENNNYYNYNINELVPINQTKMTVKRLDNFEYDDEDESESEENKNNLQNIEEEKSDDENGELDEENNQIEKNKRINVEQEKNNISKFEEEEDKKPEDKKPPNIQKLKKKGKQKMEINLF